MVDFGAGGGKNCRLVREVMGTQCRVTAVEGYEPTVQTLIEQGDYDTVRHSLIPDPGASDR